MSLILLVYLTDIITALSIVLGVFSLILILAIIAAKLEREDDNIINKIRNLLIITLTLTTILPSKNTMYLLIGQTAVKEAVSSELGAKALKLLESKIDKELKKMEDK